MSTLPRVIGIAGSFASGQDTLAKHLEHELGYLRFSTSDAVREVAMEKHGSIERPVLHVTAKALREEQGAGALVLQGIKKLAQSEYPGVLITGIRSMGELKAVMQAGGVMLYTDADPEVRYQRMVARNRDAESQLTHEAFMEREQAEWHTGDNDADFNRRDIRAFCELHGTILYNDNNLDAFFADAAAVLDKHTKQ